MGSDREDGAVSFSAQEWRLRALSPLDGRYGRQLEHYAYLFSEEALIRQRFAVEVQWLEHLAALPEVGELGPLSHDETEVLRRWVSQFGAHEALRVKEVEARTNHDVKAVEYYLKERLVSDLGWVASRAEFVHFAATSEDVNNLSYARMVRAGLAEAWLPAAEALVARVRELGLAFAGQPMLARTHGQPATPTTLGKELAVFVARWQRQLRSVRSVVVPGKWGGATGNLAAHVFAYPEVDWMAVARSFVLSLGFEWAPLTTQVEPHDWMAELFAAIGRFCTVLIDFCRDMWSYTSFGYFRLKVVAGEVGSSAMPHKLNPIDFENAEANAGIALALLGHLADKLPISRLQRDLSDSSALRNVGSAFGYAGLALGAALRGLSQVSPDPAALDADLSGAWEVLTEAVQTVMRRYGATGGYERLRDLSRGRLFSAETFRHFVRSLDLPQEVRERLLTLSPATYIGLSEQLANLIQVPGDTPEL